MSVVVLSKKEGFCPACMMVSKKLSEWGIPFEEIKVDPQSEEFIKINELTGLRQMPIVLPNGLDNIDGVFTGFDVTKLKGLRVKHETA